MKLNLLFVAAAIAYGSSVVVAQSYDNEFVTRDLADIEDFDAREFYDVDLDARELFDEELDAREFDIEDFDARDILSTKATPARIPEKLARVDKKVPLTQKSQLSSISRSRSPDSPVHKSTKLQTKTRTDKDSTSVVKKTGKGKHHRKTKGQIRVKGEGKRSHKAHRKIEGKRTHNKLNNGGRKHSSKSKQSRVVSEDKPVRKTITRRRKISSDSEQPRKMRKAVRKVESED